jgi:hypothetical protein
VLETPEYQATDVQIQRELQGSGYKMLKPVVVAVPGQQPETFLIFVRRAAP